MSIAGFSHCRFRSRTRWTDQLDGDTHELLSSHKWHGISLIELVRQELAPYAGRGNTEINGTEVILRPEAGQAMAMVLHELTTNAAKYGALSTGKRRVSIRWGQEVTGEERSPLVLKFQETDGPPVVATGKRNYGTTTIRNLIPYEFGGTVDLLMDPHGVRCRIELSADWLSNVDERISGLGNDSQGLSALKQPLQSLAHIATIRAALSATPARQTKHTRYEAVSGRVRAGKSVDERRTSS